MVFDPFWFFRRLSRITLLAGLSLLPGFANADVTLFGSGQSLTGDVIITPEQGVLAGPNLLHTFSRFNIDSDESVTFTGPSTIANVLARVLDNKPSQINGLLQSTIENADLFLLNPNGVIFGAGSSIRVDGAFYVSTADTIKFEDGSSLLLTDGDDINISIASPSAFGFVSNNSEIRFDGASISTGEGGSNSGFDAINLFGGNLRFENSELRAADTPVQIVAVTDGTDIPLVHDQFSAANGLGDIYIGNDVVIDGKVDIDTSGSRAGAIHIAGNDLTMERSVVFSDTAGDSDGAGITINLKNSLSLREGSRITADTINGSGRGGDIAVAARSVTVDGLNSTIATANRTAGGSGTITLNADNLNLHNQGTLSSQTTGPGDAGAIDLNLRALRVNSGGQLAGVTRTGGRGADINLLASESVIIGDETADLADDSGFYVASDTFIGSGAAGNITISTPSLEMRSGTIDSRSGAGLSGPGGTIAITADHFFLAEAASLNAKTLSVSQAGAIILDIGSFVQEGLVEANTEGSGTGNAGVIDINVSDYALRGSLEAFTSTSGRAGDVFISADSLHIDGGNIDVRTEAEGDAGTVIVSTPLLELSNGGQINSIVDQNGSGRGGAILLTGNNLRLHDGGTITTTTAGSGDGGQVVFSISGDVDISDIGSALSSNTNGSAAGGEISGIAANFRITDGGAITTLATAAGFAGNINLEALRSIDVSDGRIRTDSEQSGGGNITIDAVERLYLNRGELTASARGLNTGDDGGNVSIDPVFILLNDGRIVAQAIAGDGGIIQLQSDVFLSDRQSLISATSEQGNDGEVRIIAPDNGVTGVLGVLEVELDDSQPLLQLPCAATAFGERSSLIYNPGLPSVSAPEDLPFTRLEGCGSQ